MKPFSNDRGFTLIELLLGMTLLTLIMGSVFATMQTGMNAYRQGRYTMELYQSGRIGLQKIADEVSLSLSSYSFWQPRDTYKQLTYDELMINMQGVPIQEEDPGAIRFLGSGNSVLYVRKKYHLDRYPPFDLEECQIAVENGRIILRVLRSLLMVKQATWFYQHEFQVSLNGTVIPDMGGRMRFRTMGEMEEMPLQQWIGDYGVLNYNYTIAEGIKQIAFRYGEDGKWKNTWDSQELEIIHHVSPQSPNYKTTDTEIREKGPPLVVEISVTLNNGEILVTSTDVPAGNMRASFLGPGGSPPVTAPPPASNLNPEPPNETPAAVPGT